VHQAKQPIAPKTGIHMNRFFIQIAISLIVTLSAANLSFAEGTASSSADAPFTGMKPDRTTADTATRKSMQQKEATLRQKRADCRKQARQEKISFLKRPAFVSECMSR
jgi:hypothetical protein